MRLELDSSKVLYAVGVLFGIGALVYFARDLVFDLSLTVKAVLLLLVFVALFVAAAAFVTADLLVGGVAYGFAAAESAEAGDNEVTVGTVTAENEFVFRESVTFPEATACVYAPDRRDRRVEYRSGPGDWRVPDSVGAGESVTAEAWIWLENDERAAVDNGTIPVERAESCPASTDEPRIVVVVEDE